MAHARGTILLNSVVHSLVPGSYRMQPAIPHPPPIREGAPSYADQDADSVVAWNDWQDGGFAVTYSPDDPARAGPTKDVITDIPGQLTLSFLQNATTGIDEAPTKIAQLAPGERPAAISATKVWLKDDGADSWTAKGTSMTPKDIIAWGDGTNTLYLVAMGNAAAYQYTTDLTAGSVSWTTSNLGGNSQEADFFAAGPGATGTSGGTLWKALKPNLVYASADPKNGGAWTSAYTIGSSATSITAFGVFDNRLLVGKPEGLFWVKPDGTVECLIDMSGAIDSNNCVGMTSWGGYLFVPWQQGLFMFKGGYLLNVGEVNASFRDVGPYVGNQIGGDVRGKVVALLGAPTRLYAVTLSESSNYAISRYNGHPVPGKGWNCGFLWLGSSACTCMGWENPSSGNPRLYFGYGSAIRYVLLPKYGDNPLLDSSCTYAASGTVEMPEHESPLRSVTKAMLYEALDVERTATGTRYVDIASKTDDDGVIGWSTVKRVDADGLTKAYFSTNATGRRMKLQLTLATGDSTNTPRVRLLEHHWDPRPALRRRWTFQVIAAVGTTTNPTKVAKTIRDDLVTARDATATVGFEDAYGTLWDVFVESVGEVEVEKMPGMPEPVQVIPVSVREFKGGVGAFYVGDENALVGTAYAA